MTNKIPQKIEDITYLELSLAPLNHYEALKQYWGEQAYSALLEDDSEDNYLIYAIYNDELDETTQLGTLTEIYDTSGNQLVTKIYREIF